MPRGVTEQFVRLLRLETKARLRTALGMLALAPLAYFMAEMTDRPLLGRAVWITAASLVVGLLAGLLWGRHRAHRYNESLKASWNAWMRMSLSSGSVDEVDRHVREKPRHPAFAGAAWAAFLLMNGLLFLALWVEVPWAFPYGAIVGALNGLALGLVLGRALWALRWTREFAKALDELMATGQVGLWGER